MDRPHCTVVDQLHHVKSGECGHPLDIIFVRTLCFILMCLWLKVCLVSPALKLEVRDEVQQLVSKKLAEVMRCFNCLPENVLLHWLDHFGRITELFQGCIILHLLKFYSHNIITARLND